MDTKKQAAKLPPKKVTSENLESLKDGKFREPATVATGKKKSTVPSDTG